MAGSLLLLLLRRRKKEAVEASKSMGHGQIDPGEIVICKRADGSDWLLGQGSYGKVRPGMTAFPLCAEVEAVGMLGGVIRQVAGRPLDLRPIMRPPVCLQPPMVVLRHCFDF